MLRTLENNLAYYQDQKKQIINNKHSYTSEHHYQEYGVWQSASYTFNYAQILRAFGASNPSSGSGCFRSIKCKKNKYAQYLRGDLWVQGVLRHKIAENLGRPVDDINPNVIAGGGHGTVCKFGERAYFYNYTIGYSYRNLHTKHEKYFDQEKYNQALKECERNIENTRIEITDYKEQEKLQQQINNVQGDINHNKNQANIIQSKINTELRKKQEFEQNYGQIQESNDRQSDELKNKQEQNFGVVNSVNDKQRAFFLAELWGQANMKEIIDRIKYLGFDASELAHLAILKNHTELFEYALQSRANCANYIVDGKTLLQHLIHQNKDSFILKVLEKENDISTTLITAISQNDISTLTKLHSIDSNLIKQKFAGYSLLQIAISTENPHIEIINTLLTLDNTLIEVLNNNGETALKIAIRCGNENITELIKQHADLNVEIEQLNLDQSIKNEILNTHNLDKLIELYREEHTASEYEIIEDIENQYNEAQLLGLEDLHL